MTGYCSYPSPNAATEFASSQPGLPNPMTDKDTTTQTNHNWSRADAMTESDIHAAALSDPNAQPLTPDRLATMRPIPRTKFLRRALGLTQEAFAARFQIPLGTLRDWEQGAAQPDQTARAYLRAIAGDPAAVQRALESAPRNG